jgi:NTE family protein
VRRLGERGLLARLDLVSAISGGAILAAFLADRLRPWPRPGTCFDAEAFDAVVAGPFRRLAASNLRRGLWLAALRHGSFVEGMRALYARRLSARTLETLPERPRFVFNATDLNFGTGWVFERDRVGSYRAGYVDPQRPEAAARWTVARAVAASSCFPPLFRPMRLAFEPEALRGVRRWTARYSELAACIRLTDGGVYDNLGLQPALSARHEILLVSDGGAPFRRLPTRGRAGELVRYAEVLQGQVGALRRVQLRAAFGQGPRRGAYWTIGAASASAGGGEAPGYSAAFAAEVLAGLRTDLDGFSDAERAALENHGYARCEAALQAYLPDHLGPPVPFCLPFPAWTDELRLRHALRDGGQRRCFGRRFAPPKPLGLPALMDFRTDFEGSDETPPEV